MNTPARNPEAFGWDDPIPCPPPRATLADTDRAELCRRVDFLALLAGDGVDVRRNGAAWLCRLRDEGNPSCHVYPPGVGRYGAKGWTWHDYGTGKGGDALAYLVDVRGLPFLDAARLLAEKGGWMPDCLRDTEKDRPGCPRKAERKGGPCPDTPPPPRAPVGAAMPPDAQWTACAVFLSALSDLDPDAAPEGEAYLRGRGCLPHGWPEGVAYRLRADLCGKLAAHLAAMPEAPDLLRAGLLKAEAGKPPRLAWWGECVLLVCHDAEAYPVYLLARRLDWRDGDRLGKYLNQPCGGGAVRWPFNLPALYHAAGRLPAWPVTAAPEKAGDVLLVEGPLDALRAAALGWPAVALLNRPQAHDYKDRDGAAARMLEAHLPALRDVARVRIVPDADPGKKGAEGEALAARLVGWLRFAGVRRVDVARLADLCPDAPEGCKDLADIAQAATKGNQHD